MKKIYFALLFVGVISSAQTSIAWKSETAIDSTATAEETFEHVATSDKEYKYLTIGLKSDLASGKDIIKGYNLDLFMNKKVGAYRFKIYHLFNDKKQIKAISVQIHSNVTNQDHFVCIPFNNDSLSTMNQEQIKLFTQPMAQAYATIISEAFMSMSNMLLNCVNKSK